MYKNLHVYDTQLPTSAFVLYLNLQVSWAFKSSSNFDRIAFEVYDSMDVYYL